jgi:hypothetical protein
MARTSTAILIAAALAATSAGCSSSGSVQAGGGTAAIGSGVTAALHQIHADADTRQFFQYGDIAGIEKVDGGLNPQAPLGGVLGFGAPAFDSAFDIAGKTGIDTFHAASLAIGAGSLGKTEVGLLYGTFDTSAIASKLPGLGYHSSGLGGGETLWVYQADQAAGSQAIPFPGAGHNFDAVRVSATRIVYGATPAGLAAVLAPGPTLADDPAYAAIGDCLRTARAAMIVRNPATGRLVGYGASATTAADEAELICIPSASQAAAQALAAKWPAAVASASDGQEAWASLLSSPTATVLGGNAHVVRLSAHAQQQSGAIIDRWAEGTVDPLLAALDPTLAQSSGS